MQISLENLLEELSGIEAVTNLAQVAKLADLPLDLIPIDKHDQNQEIIPLSDKPALGKDYDRRVTSCLNQERLLFTVGGIAYRGLQESKDRE